MHAIYNRRNQYGRTQNGIVLELGRTRSRTHTREEEEKILFGVVFCFFFRTSETENDDGGKERE